MISVGTFIFHSWWNTLLCDRISRILGSETIKIHISALEQPWLPTLVMYSRNCIAEWFCWTFEVFTVADSTNLVDHLVKIRFAHTFYFFLHKFVSLNDTGNRLSFFFKKNNYLHETNQEIIKGFVIHCRQYAVFCPPWPTLRILLACWITIMYW